MTMTTTRATNILLFQRTIILFLLACSSLLLTLVGGAEFNYEVEKRVLEHLDNFMAAPVLMTTTMSNLLTVGGVFGHNFRGPDRDMFLRIAASLPVYHIYYSLEDGTTGVHCSFDGKYGVYYRESGPNGYQSDEPSMQKHYKSCFDNTNGEIENCTMSTGTPYARCVDDCELELCPDEDSQRDCTTLDDDRASQVRCEHKKKYCMKYETVYVEEGESLGHIPMVGMCHDVYGLPTQEVGKVQRSYMPSPHDLAATLSPFDGSYMVGDPPRELENCYYKDGKTLVQSQHVEDEYDYCGGGGGGNGTKCNPFIGAFTHFTFDPRVEAYHLDSKRLQEPYWTEPYVFFNNELGIGFIHPLYKIVDGKNVFNGIVGSDYILTEITEYLQDFVAQASANTGIAIFDDASDPHYYLIGSSTGTLGLSTRLADDETTPCPPDDENADCALFRVPASHLEGTSTMNDILYKAFETHNEAGFPKELISFKATDDELVFVSQVSLFESRNLRWRILVVSPAEKGSTDTIESGDPYFAAVLVVALFGLAVCTAFLVTFYGKRKEKAVICSDWRFTCAFIAGCAFLNGSSLAVLGPNTDATCMLRMWLFHFFLVAALAPLFVKIWRMKKLVGSPALRRVTVSNTQAALYACPMLLIQVIILTMVSIFDPPVQTETIEENANIIVQRLTCEHDTNAIFIATLIYEGGLVLFGCFLAYQSRHLDDLYGESKQLIFAMYNILLVGVTFLILLSVADIDQKGQKLLLTIGVFWGSVLSSAAFVVPRLIQVRTAARARKTVGADGASGSIHISGLHDPSSSLNVNAPRSGNHASSELSAKSRRDFRSNNSNLASIDTATSTPEVSPIASNSSAVDAPRESAIEEERQEQQSNIVPQSSSSAMCSMSGEVIDC